MNQAYRTLKIEIPWRVVEERPDVLDLVVRMRQAAEEFARKLSKELTGKERARLVPEEFEILFAKELIWQEFSRERWIPVPPPSERRVPPLAPDAASEGEEAGGAPQDAGKDLL